MAVEIDEWLDLVDDNDSVIGKKMRSQVYDQDLSNFRVINVFIRNLSGEIWIPRRTADKKLFPLCLDVSMGGHVSSGETYDEAMARELKEELNLDASQTRIKELGRLNPKANGVSAFMTVYEIETEVEPDFNPGDFVEAFWIQPAELLERLDTRKDKGKGDLPTLVRHFYG